jgi:superfamily II DNA or RNA helicase
VCEYAPRLEFVVKSVEELLAKEPSRKVIILSDRRQHLENLGASFKQLGRLCGNYFGGMKNEELKTSENAQIILGTFCMVSEGFDCKSLDTLVLASPKSDVVQSVGRILREEASKRHHTPTVIDIMDAFSIFERQSQKRLKYYKTQRYNMLGDVEVARDNKLIKLDGPCFLDLES